MANSKYAAAKTEKALMPAVMQCAEDFIGAAPMQAAAEISGGDFPFLRAFAPLYLRGAACGFSKAALQGLLRQNYDVIFIHSLPAALRRGFRSEILPQLLRLLRPEGKMLLLETAPFGPEAELRALAQKAESDLVKFANLPLAATGAAAAKQPKQRLAFFRNPQILLA